MIAPNPYAILGALGAIALAAGGGYWRGSQAEHTRHVARELAQASAATAKADALAATIRERDAALVAQEDTRRVETREIVREVPKLVSRTVYRTACVDDDGLRLLARAASAANGGTDPAGRSDDAAAKVSRANGE